MKVVHVPFCFHPDPVGGTEVYVEALARAQVARGLEVLIAAPGEADRTYEHAGLPVARFAIEARLRDLGELYGAGDPAAAARFDRLLEAERPDLVHLHAFTRAASLRLVRTARRRGVPVVFTYHTPTVSCLRGTLLRWGAEVCDGALDGARCAGCMLEGHGLARPAATLLGRLPVGVSRLPGRLGLSGGTWTALRARGLTELRHAAFRALMAEVDCVVVLCDWTRQLLLRNGVPDEKISLSRHGLLAPPADAGDHPATTAPPPLRLAFLGRFDPTKGPDVLIRALRSLPDAPVVLDLYGIAQGAAGATYRAQLERLAAGDRRISFLPPVPSEQVVDLLRGYHALAVPSRWLETGPLVVLEAFAAGIPILGTRLGGIAELLRHDADGLLVPAEDVRGWAHALELLLSEPALLARLRAGVRPPRRMVEVSEDMARLYDDVLIRARGVKH